jgi:copper chaperone NosL
MGVVDRRFAAQLVAPGEEPLFFDDIGCLRDYLARAASVPDGAIAYVSEHRTRAWVPAAAAVYTRAPHVQTPMDSGLIAHSDSASRNQDPDAEGGTALTAIDVFGPRGAPGGRK